MALRYPYPLATVTGEVTRVDVKTTQGQLSPWATELTVQTEPNGGPARILFPVREGFDPKAFESLSGQPVEVLVALGARSGGGSAEGRSFLNLTGAEAPRVLAK